jgi:hypothetical protein
MAKNGKSNGENGGIKKKDFSAFQSIQTKFSSVAKMKPQEYFIVDQSFYEISGLPGPAKGHINMFLGHSDSGKSTAMVKAAADAQKKGILPVFIITEQKWSWDHAKLLGFEYDETVDDNGEKNYNGFYVFNNNFKTIEEITDFMNLMLDEQAAEKLPYELLFLWDSVGSVPCQSTYEGKGGKMHNASVLSDRIGMGLNQRISGSRTVESKYTNTLVVVNQPWVDVDMKSPMSQPKIKPKGGENIYLNSTLVFLFGNQRDAGISRLDAQKDGRKIAFATRSKVSVVKNHINGLGYVDGRIICTPHGFIKDDKAEIDKYKKDHSDYWNVILGEGDYEIVADVKLIKDSDNEE